MNFLLNRLDNGPSISIGMCLPAVCSVDHLQRTINEMIRKKLNGVSMKIPKNTCQPAENVAELKTIDWFAM